MKTRFYLLVACVSALSVSGQTTIQLKNHDASKMLVANEVIYLATQAESNTKVTIDIKNTSSSTKSYNAKRYDVLMNSNATSTAVAYFCVAGTCYGTDTYISPSPLTLNGGQSASDLPGSFQMLIADLDEATTVGLSLVKYTFQNVNNPADSIQISIKYNSSPTGTSTTTGLNESAISLMNNIGPSPATEILNLTLYSSVVETTQIIVFDINGKEVLQKDIVLFAGPNSVKLPVYGLPPAMYVLHVRAGGVQASKRFLIN